MPGLFIVPLFFTLFNVRPNNQSLMELAKIPNNKKCAILLFLGLILISYLWNKMVNFSDIQINEHGGVGVADLRGYSIALTVFLLAVWVLKVAEFVRNYGFLNQYVSFKKAFYALFFMLSSASFLYYFIDWSAGFRGPPLFDYILLQSMSSPLKSLVSHLLYFGPVFFMALILFFTSSRPKVNETPFFLLIMSVFPVLLLGSESRQWLFILPVAVMYVTVVSVNYKNLWLCLLISIGLCLPLFFIKEQIRAIVDSGYQDFSSTNWQFYFGRQGPWMSLRTYTLGLLLANIFFVSLWISDKLSKTSDIGK